MKIDALVLRVLALRQPVAYDLRFLTSALKLVTDLERIGDEAVSIAERAKEGAEQVLMRDDAIDQAYGDVVDAMTAFMRDEPAEIPSAIRVIKVAKYIERIADHATNIAEEVIFMVRGDDVRHLRTPPAEGGLTRVRGLASSPGGRESSPPSLATLRDYCVMVVAPDPHEGSAWLQIRPRPARATRALQG